jgi:chloramphenicol 3-O-phosphotransferase
VLNGTSSAGSSSIALAQQRRWSGPLQVSGLNAFLLPGAVVLRANRPPRTARGCHLRGHAQDSMACRFHLAPPEVAAERLAARGAVDVPDRLTAWDATETLGALDLNIDISQITPTGAARIIHSWRQGRGPAMLDQRW